MDTCCKLNILRFLISFISNTLLLVCNINIFKNKYLQHQHWDVVKQKKKKKKHQKKLSWGSDKSINLTNSAKDISNEITIETLSTTSSTSLSSEGSTNCQAAGTIRAAASDQPSGTARTKPLSGMRRSLDLGPTHRSQNRRFSEQIKQTSNKSPSCLNGNINNADAVQFKMNGNENGFLKLKKSKSNGTITELSNTCTETSKSRGIKHWFPGIKDTVT